MQTLYRLSQVVIALATLTMSAQATELTYRPINPSFGGNSPQGNFLIGKAQSQNKHKAPVVDRNAIDSFQDSLERRVLSQMAREIVDTSFGEGDFSEGGTFSTDMFSIEVDNSDPFVVIVTIINKDTGEETIIEMPVLGP